MPEPLEVAELGPDRVADYFRLFDRAFVDNPRWDGCYCAFHDDASGQPWQPQRDAQQHRPERESRIRSGTAQGLLAYSQGIPVGWCNVAPRSQVPNLRFAGKAVVEPDPDPAVILCFVIDPGHRGQGVASALVRAAIDLARRWRAPWLEGYPADENAPDEGLPWTARAYTGPLSMYRSAGFEVVSDMGGWWVVRHDLTEDP